MFFFYHLRNFNSSSVDGKCIQFDTTWADPEVGDRGQDPLKIRKNIGFLSKTGPDCLKNHKATKPAFNVGSSSARQRNAI